MPLPKARVPVVKFFHAGSQMSCDVCLNNHLATENTRLLRTYAAIDPRMRQMVILVKYWAKRRGVNTPYKGTLSSYAYVLLVIFYLQTRPQPILPVLQKIRTEKTALIPDPIIEGHNCYFCDDLEHVEKLGFMRNCRNTETVGQLLLGFFSFLGASNGFNYRDDVVSIREGRPLTKADKEWTASSNTRRDRFWLCIEDPFELSHNLGRVADRDSLYTMRGEFMRAVRAIKDGNIAAACDEFVEPAGGGGVGGGGGGGGGGKPGGGKGGK